jgi:hypothetical protein
VASTLSTGNSGSPVVVPGEVVLDAVVSVAEVDVVAPSFGLHAANAIIKNTMQTTRKRDLIGLLLLAGREGAGAILSAKE